VSETSSLSYAVRPRVVGKYLGQLVLLLGGLTLVPLVFSLLDGDRALATTTAVAVAVLMAAGWLLQRLHAAEQDVQANEAVVVVAATFIVASLALALSMMAAHVSFLDALFEAVSGITTTGLSTFDTVADKPRSLLFEAAWLQWVGGLGVMVLSVALLFGQGTSAKLLSGVIAQPDGVLGGTRAYASVVIRVYLALTVVGIVALAMTRVGWFPAVTLTLSAVSTGGFSPYDASLMGSSLAVQSVVMALCAAGAIALPLYYQAARGQWATVLGDPELKALVVACLVVAGLLVVRDLALHEVASGRVESLALLAVSAQTTAGFATADVDGLDAFSKIVLIAAMTVGGGVGSSAGGVKLLRLIVLMKLVHLVIVRTRVTPHAVTRLRVGGREPADEEMLRMLIVIGLHTGAIVLSWAAFAWFGHDALDGLFEVVSAVGTVGLSTGITGPDLHPVLKGVLCVDMLLGRLEVLPILLLLAPRTWFGHTRAVERAGPAAVTDHESGNSRSNEPGRDHGAPVDQGGPRGRDDRS
jgi:trk system potassium uptake protein TrkH